MLKKKIKALALVTAILLNVVVSVNAKHSVTSIEDVTTTLLKESFDGMTYSQTGYKHHDEEVELTGTELGIKQTWNTATIAKGTEEGNNHLSQIVDTNKTNLYFNPSNSVQLKKGDKIKLTFDFRQNDAEAKFVMKLKGNNTATYTHVSGNSLSNGNQDGIILSKIRCRIVPGYLDYGDSNYYTLNKWCSATITIDTMDEEQSNAQTLKVVLVDENKSATRTYYGTLDADGDGSNGITALTSFDGFEFTTEPRKYDAENADNCVPTKLDLDDIVIEHITEEEVVTWISDLSKTLIDDDIDYATGNASMSANDVDWHTFWANSNISYKKYQTYDAPKFYVTANGQTGNALQLRLRSGGAIKFNNPEGTTNLNEGDIIHINYDIFHADSTGANMFVNLNDNANGTFKLLDYTEGCWIKDFVNNEEFTSNPGRPGIANMVFANSKVAFYDGYGGLSLPSNAYTNVDILVNTKDPRYDDKQTVKITIGDQYMIGEYDANYTGADDTTVDKFTSVSSLLFDTNGSYGETYVRLDNIKLDVIKPGVEVYGTAVDSCEAGKFVNGALTAKMAIGTSYPNASKEIYVFVATYNSEGTLVGVEPVSKKICGGDCIIDLNKEISITNDVHTIKLLAWDLDNLTPYMDAEVLTRAD